jgi:hypothetical protein
VPLANFHSVNGTPTTGQNAVNFSFCTISPSNWYVFLRSNAQSKVLGDNFPTNLGTNLIKNLFKMHPAFLIFIGNFSSHTRNYANVAASRVVLIPLVMPSNLHVWAAHAQEERHFRVLQAFRNAIAQMLWPSGIDWANGQEALYKYSILCHYDFLFLFLFSALTLE